MVDEHDVQSMAAHMITLAKDVSLARKMGQAGRKHMEEYGDIEKITAAIKELLAEAASKGA